MPPQSRRSGLAVVIKQMVGTPQASVCHLPGPDGAGGQRRAAPQGRGRVELLYEKMPYLSKSVRSGINWVKERVVASDKIITAATDADAIPFADAILSARQVGLRSEGLMSSAACDWCGKSREDQSH